MAAYTNDSKNSTSFTNDKKSSAKRAGKFGIGVFGKAKFDKGESPEEFSNDTKNSTSFTNDSKN